MRVYTQSIWTALLVFPFIAALLTVPYVLWTYRRYGAVSFFRSVILFSFLLYLMCAYFLVIFPLPDPGEVARMTGPTAQLQPFSFVRSFLSRTVLRLGDARTYLAAMKQPVFYQPVFNVLLAMPFGIYLVYYFRLRLVPTLLLSFGLSLFFELTQLTGLYGIYPRAYRTFDVDDLILNTFGGLIGYLIGLGMHRVLPARRMIDRGSYARSHQVTLTRRAVALLLDMVLLSAVDMFLPKHGLLDAMLYALYFVALQARLGGRTPGKAFVRIRIVPSGAGGALWSRLLVRYALLGLFPALYWVMQEANLLAIPLLGMACLAVLAALLLYTLIDMVRAVHAGGPRRLWYERMSHTTQVSTLRKGKQMHPPPAER